MKIKSLILSMVAIPAFAFSQSCYKVSDVRSSADAPEMKKERVLFGIKQITEEVLSEKFSLCNEGLPVTVDIISIEAPSVGVSVGPFMVKKKETIITIKINKDGVDYIGEGSAKVSVKATFIDLNDENLPFNKTSFAGAIKKSIEDSISKM
jgi:hypothetical protein